MSGKAKKLIAQTEIARQKIRIISLIRKLRNEIPLGDIFGPKKFHEHSTMGSVFASQAAALGSILGFGVTLNYLFLY